MNINREIKAYKGVLRPVVTEKSSQSGDLVLIVAPELSKPEIREAVELLFEVKVLSVRTVNYMGKVKTVKGRSGRRAGYKKAYVSLQGEHSVDMFERI